MKTYLKLLGHECTDRVTEFKGVIESISFDLYGGVQAVVKPRETSKDGAPQEGRWFDVKRLKISDSPPVMIPPDFASMNAGDEIGPAEKPLRRG